MQPLYRKVQEGLAERIGSMRPGELLPSEPELEREYGVSRVTIRRAVDNLVAEGLLTKRQGFGTIVREPEAIQDVGRIYSWFHEMRRRNVDTTSTLISLTKQAPSRRLAEELKLGPDERVVALTRVRHVKNAPIAIMVNYLRERYVPDLADVGLDGDSLYDTLIDRYGLELAGGDEFIQARAASHLEASLLDIDEGAPILNVRRTTYLRGDIPFEFVDMAARGDTYQYHAKLDGGMATRAHDS